MAKEHSSSRHAKEMKERENAIAKKAKDDYERDQTKEEMKADTYYHQDREEYMSHTPDERATMAVPKTMLEREYDKAPGGGYVHKRKGTYRE